MDIHPQWNKTTDCISDQIQRANQSLLALDELSLAELIRTLYQSYGTSLNSTLSVDYSSLLLLYWASNSVTSGNLLGIESRGNTYTPTWICANFSIRSYVSSLDAHPGAASEIYHRWNTAFQSYGNNYAMKYKVPVIIGSQAFTVPILAQEVLDSIIIAGIVSVSGFVGCILLFTWRVSVTILGSLLIAEVAILTICFHKVIIPMTFDLLDVVVIVAIVGMLVDFPAHIILFILRKRQQPMNKRSSDDHSDILAEDIASVTIKVKEGDVKYNSKECWPGIDDIFVHDGLYAGKLLLMPTILILSVSIPLCFATFVLLQKTGQYMIVLSVTSYICSILLLPYLLLLTK